MTSKTYLNKQQTKLDFSREIGTITIRQTKNTYNNKYVGCKFLIYTQIELFKGVFK